MKEKTQMARVYVKMLSLTAVKETKSEINQKSVLPIQFAEFETIHNTRSWEGWQNGHLLHCRWGHE